MKYLLGKTSLRICFLAFASLSAEGKSRYENISKKGSAYVPDAQFSKQKDSHSVVENNGKEKYSYSFIYMKDRYGIYDKERQGIFENIYNKRYGTLLASYDCYFYRKKVNLAWGFGMGLGYNQGNPRFASEADKSEIIFRLYTLFLDASVAGEIHPVSFLKLMVKAGPSFMGLYRSRNDRDAGEKGKNIRQIGAGGFAQAVVKTGMGQLFPSWGKYLKKEYQIYGLFLNMGVRYQYYGGFKDSRVERVDGLSYMAGLSFEFR